MDVNCTPHPTFRYGQPYPQNIQALLSQFNIKIKCFTDKCHRAINLTGTKLH